MNASCLQFIPLFLVYKNTYTGHNCLYIFTSLGISFHQCVIIDYDKSYVHRVVAQNLTGPWYFCPTSRTPCWVRICVLWIHVSPCTFILHSPKHECPLGVDVSSAPSPVCCVTGVLLTCAGCFPPLWLLHAGESTRAHSPSVYSKGSMICKSCPSEIQRIQHQQHGVSRGRRQPATATGKQKLLRFLWRESLEGAAIFNSVQLCEHRAGGGCCSFCRGTSEI